MDPMIIIDLIRTLIIIYRACLFLINHNLLNLLVIIMIRNKKLMGNECSNDYSLMEI
jgi:hypothetical protein